MIPKVSRCQQNHVGFFHLQRWRGGERGGAGQESDPAGVCGIGAKRFKRDAKAGTHTSFVFHQTACREKQPTPERFRRRSRNLMELRSKAKQSHPSAFFLARWLKTTAPQTQHTRCPSANQTFPQCAHYLAKSTKNQGPEPSNRLKT